MRKQKIAIVVMILLCFSLFLLCACLETDDNASGIGGTENPSLDQEKEKSEDDIEDIEEPIIDVEEGEEDWDEDEESEDKDDEQTKEYSIDYILNGGINNINNPHKRTLEQEVVLYDAFRDGFIFRGWFDNINFYGIARDYIPKGFEGNIILYASWEQEASDEPIEEEIEQPIEEPPIEEPPIKEPPIEEEPVEEQPIEEEPIEEEDEIDGQQLILNLGEYSLNAYLGMNNTLKNDSAIILFLSSYYKLKDEINILLNSNLEEEKNTYYNDVFNADLGTYHDAFHLFNVFALNNNLDGQYISSDLKEFFVLSYETSLASFKMIDYDQNKISTLLNAYFDLSLSDKIVLSNVEYYSVSLLDSFDSLLNNYFEPIFKNSQFIMITISILFNINRLVILNDYQNLSLALSDLQYCYSHLSQSERQSFDNNPVKIWLDFCLSLGE